VHHVLVLPRFSLHYYCSTSRALLLVPSPVARVLVRRLDGSHGREGPIPGPMAPHPYAIKSKSHSETSPAFTSKTSNSIFHNLSITCFVMVDKCSVTEKTYHVWSWIKVPNIHVVQGEHGLRGDVARRGVYNIHAHIQVCWL